jgi:cellulose synthase/poly-beta-1,6-N-acetylglucosamine synthase-like glycosyltransferase
MAKGRRQKDKQYNGQRLWPLYCLSFCRFPLAIILFVLLSFSFTIILFVLLLSSFGPYTVCPFVAFLWPLYCLSFFRFPFAIILFVLCWFSFVGQKKNEKKTNNVMAKGKPPKDKQYNGQRKTTKGQTI